MLQVCSVPRRTNRELSAVSGEAELEAEEVHLGVQGISCRYLALSQSSSCKTCVCVYIFIFLMHDLISLLCERNLS